MIRNGASLYFDGEYCAEDGVPLQWGSCRLRIVFFYLDAAQLGPGLWARVIGPPILIPMGCVSLYCDSFENQPSEARCISIGIDTLNHYLESRKFKYAIRGKELSLPLEEKDLMVVR
jgi:hypothetical protein